MRAFVRVVLLIEREVSVSELRIYDLLLYLLCSLIMKFVYLMEVSLELIYVFACILFLFLLLSCCGINIVICFSDPGQGIYISY